MSEYREMLARHFQARLKEAAGDAAAYRQAIEEKAAAIRAGNGPESENLRILEDRLAWLENHSRELTGAIDAGRLARATVHDILHDLQRLRPYALPGTTMLSPNLKYGLVDALRAQDARLQKELQAFSSQLADIQLRFDHTAEVGKLTRSDHVLLDIPAADDETLARVLFAAERMQAFQEPLRTLLENLENARREICAEREALAGKRRVLIEAAGIFPFND